MSLNEEWRRRVEHWERAIWSSFYQPLGEAALEGFTTFDRLSQEQALKGEFKPMPEGTPWGKKWEYAWFRGSLTLPEAARGKRIALKFASGSECLIWVNGVLSGSIGWGHKEMTLAMSGKPGTRYDILIEDYAGHGPTPEGAGPVPYGTISVPEPPAQQVKVGKLSFGVWDEELYQLAFDYSTLLKLRKGLDANSLRLAEIDAGLMEATLIIDMELPPAERSATIKAGRERLKPLLACKNGSTAPTLFAIGHAHLDIMWLWPHAETERKVARTLVNQLALMAEYPEYAYLQSQTHLLRLLKTLYPDLYAKAKARAAKGQFVTDGGMWVEADTNIAGGEALIRQCIHGKRFFKEEFGVDSKVLWLPDVFGYTGALPQILRGCGITGFATTKINWTYNGADRFPYTTFIWEGIDGSELYSHIFNDYNRFPSADLVQQHWNERNQRNNVDAMILSYGWGDGGGGPTREHLEYIRRLGDLEGAPRVRMASPQAFFSYLESRPKPRERYVGELYFQAHRGTYTTQAKTKQGNRKSELALREAEVWGVAAHALKGFDFSSQTLDETWKSLLLHQFHDILPGSSIHRVYEETEAAQAAIIAAAQKSAASAVSALVTPGTGGKPSIGSTVFNSLSWKRSVLAPVSAGSGITQKVNGQTVAEVTVPALGWKTALPASGSAAPGSGAVTVTPQGADILLENDLIKAVFNPRGEITSLYDKESRSEFVLAGVSSSGPCNSFKLYKDVPNWFDAWDVDSMTLQNPVELEGTPTLEVVSTGPLVAELKLVVPLPKSTIHQIIRLRRASRRIDFQTTVDWHEDHRLLKVAFPVNIYANEAIHEIQFGHIRRPNHTSRPFDADRFEVSNHKWSALAEETRGAALLNDSKYGLNVLGNTLQLTLLRSPLAPDMTADRGVQTFTYAFYTWNGSLADSGVVQEAYDLNVPALVVPGSAPEGWLLSLDDANIVVETIKPAEDGSSALVVRLYEAMRSHTHCTLKVNLPVKSAAETNMLEQVLHELPLQNGAIELDFRPFEIKTICLR